jgi:hypothetical protein
MVHHMLWILTSEEFDELALYGITIPHGQWTLTLVLSHGLIKQFNEPQLWVVYYISKEIILCLTVVKVLCP